MSMNRPLCLISLVMLSTVGVGCGGSDKKPERAVVPVAGRVLLDGEPIQDADVVLHPAQAVDDGLPVYMPRGRTGADGTFRLSTYRTGDGAPPGEYLVALSWGGPLAGLSEDEQDALPERLSRKYLLPGTSGIKVAVESTESGVTLQDFELE